MPDAERCLSFISKKYVSFADYCYIFNGGLYIAQMDLSSRELNI